MFECPKISLNPGLKSAKGQSKRGTLFGVSFSYLETAPGDDEALVLRAVANGPALRFASPRLRGSRAVLRRALPREEEALRWASEAPWLEFVAE